MIVEFAALVAVVVVVGAQLVHAARLYREHRAARQRAERLLDRHLARHDGGPWHG